MEGQAKPPCRPPPVTEDPAPVLCRLAPVIQGQARPLCRLPPVMGGRPRHFVGARLAARLSTMWDAPFRRSFGRSWQDCLSWSKFHGFEPQLIRSGF